MDILLHEFGHMILYNFSKNDINNVNKEKNSFSLDNKNRKKEFIFNEAFSIFIEIRFLEYIKNITTSKNSDYLKYFKKVDLSNKYPIYSELKDIKELKKILTNLKGLYIENEKGYINLENTLIESELEKNIKGKIDLENFKITESLINNSKLKFKESFELFERNNNFSIIEYLKNYINVYDNYGYFLAELIAIILNKRVNEDFEYIKNIEKVLENYNKYTTDDILKILNINLNSDFLYNEVVEEIELLF